MIQAARSGKQNIVEGCAASPTSAKTEIRLISVAKASLQELLEDFKDYLSTHNHRQWEMDSKEMAAMRRIGKEHTDATFFMEIAKTRPPETIANMAIVLITASLLSLAFMGFSGVDGGLKALFGLESEQLKYISVPLRH